MSSFRNKKRKDPFFMKCYHCGINTRIHKCHNCGLWNSNFNENLIPKSDKIIGIKNIFIINLIDDKIRLNIFNKTLSKSNIKTNNRKWQVYPALNGRDSKLIEESIKDFTEGQKKVINYHLKKNPGSIGCFLSHVNLWKYIFENESIGQYSLILEDDAYFAPNSFINMELIIKKSSKYKWDLLYIGHNKLNGYQINPIFIKPNNRIFERGFNSGFYGYIINKKSIPKLLSIVCNFKSPFIDVQIRNNFGKLSAIFLKNPLIFHNYSFKSSRKKIDRN